LDLTNKEIVIMDNGPPMKKIRSFRATNLLKALIEVRDLSNPNQEIVDYDDRIRQIHEAVDPLVHGLEI